MRMLPVTTKSPNSPSAKKAIRWRMEGNNKAILVSQALHSRQQNTKIKFQKVRGRKN